VARFKWELSQSTEQLYWLLGPGQDITQEVSSTGGLAPDLVWSKDCGPKLKISHFTREGLSHIEVSTHDVLREETCSINVQNWGKSAVTHLLHCYYQLKCLRSQLFTHMEYSVDYIGHMILQVWKFLKLLSLSKIFRLWQVYDSGQIHILSSCHSPRPNFVQKISDFSSDQSP